MASPRTPRTCNATPARRRLRSATTPGCRSRIAAATWRRLLRALVAAYPIALDEIVLIGHSMGGLVIRAACQSGCIRRTGRGPRRCAMCSTSARRTTTPTSSASRRAPPARCGRCRIRSPGWSATCSTRGRAASGARSVRTPRPPREAPPALATLPWLPTARHWLLVGTLTEDPRHPVTQALGDGLVRVPKSDPPGARTRARRARRRRAAGHPSSAARARSGGIRDDPPRLLGCGRARGRDERGLASSARPRGAPAATPTHFAACARCARR